MKKLALISVIVSISVLASLFVQADISETNKNKQSVMVETQNQHLSWLGVRLEDVPFALGKHLYSVLKNNQGVLIKHISHNSPAADAGLQTYDIIVKFNNQEIYSSQQLSQLIQGTQAETKVQLSIVRQGKLIDKEVKLKASPNKNLNSNQQPYSLPFPHFDPWADMNIPFWINDSFFNSAFEDRFYNRFNHWNTQRKQFHQQTKQTMQQNNSWSQFESINIKSKGTDKYHAEVKYKDIKGNRKEFTFKGQLDAIREQINAQDEMDEEKKQSLLHALNINQNYQIPFRQNRFMIPNWSPYNQY